MELIGKSVGNNNAIVSLSLDELDAIQLALQFEMSKRHNLGFNTIKIEQLLGQMKKELKKIEDK